MKQQKTSYIFSADVVRALAITAVIAIHVYYPLYSRPNYLGGISWWYAHIINAISQVAVPFFIMLSGYLILGKTENLQTSLSRALWRIGLPLMVWSSLYFYWHHAWFGRPATPNRIVTGFASANLFHFYFLVILFNLYLITPFLRQLLTHLTSQAKRYLLALSLIATFTIGISHYLIKDQTLHTFFTIWIPYLSYYLLGCIVRQTHFTHRHYRAFRFLYLSMLTFGIVSSWRNLGLFQKPIDQILWLPSGQQYFTDPLSLNVLLMSVSAFILLVKTPNFLDTVKHHPTRFLVKLVSSAAYGMYITHFIIIDYLDKKLGWMIHLVEDKLWLHITQKMIIVYFTSLIITLIGLNLPLVKKTLGQK